MRSRIKSSLKRWLPPALLDLVRRPGGIEFHGDYRSWAEASAASRGYDDSAILDKVTQAHLRVVRGEAACEQDGLSFDEVETSRVILSGLAWIAAKSEAKLDVIDYGGSLGTTYFKYRNFIERFDEVSWRVVEQPHYVEVGRTRFANDQLSFHTDLGSCLAEGSSHAVIFSAALQYLPNPYEVLNSVVEEGIQTIVLDRVAFAADGRERLTVQRVPPTIYRGSYPCWFFSEEKLFAVIGAGYRMVERFRLPSVGNLPSRFEGSLWELR